MMKLYYFDLPGRGESIRLLLHHAKVPFEDIRVQFPDWPKLKESLEGKQLPILEVDGKKYAQSVAILEYLGMKYGYLPVNPKELYENMCVMNISDDVNEKLFNAYAPYSSYDEEAKKKMKEDIPKNIFPVFLAHLEKRLAVQPSREGYPGNRSRACFPLHLASF